MNEIFGCFHKMLINIFIALLENHGIHLHTDKVFSPHHVNIRVYMFFYMLFQTDINFNIFLSSLFMFSYKNDSWKFYQNLSKFLGILQLYRHHQLMAVT